MFVWMKNGGHIWKEHTSNYTYPFDNSLLMHTESRAHIVYYSNFCGKFMDVNSAMVPQADILPLTQNIGNWDIKN